MSNFNPFSCNGESNVLLVSGLSVVGNGTGLFLFDGEQIQKIDNLPTAGVCCATDDYLVRMLCSDAEPESPGELMIYDQAGVQHYSRVPALADAHDIMWDGESVVCTATGNNKLVWLSLAGEIKRTWNAPGENDAWHLNGLCYAAGGTYFSAFGFFARHREWNESPEHAHPGLIYSLSEGKVEIAGLDCPHNPMLLDEGWLVCNSKKFEILNLENGTGLLKRSFRLKGWTRGLAASTEFYFVGESANRKKLTVGASANVCIIDRQSWELRDRIAFPVTEITSLVLVPQRFVRALRRGFRTNVYRESVNETQDLFRNTGNHPVYFLTTMDPLPVEAYKVSIRAELPQTAFAGSTLAVPVAIDNLGTGVLASSPPCPVHLTYAWFEANSDKRIEGEGQRIRLPRVLPPSHHLDCDMKIPVPQRPGRYSIHITLVQEWLANFSEVDPSNAFVGDVHVKARNAIDRVSSAVSEALRVFAGK